MIKTQNLINNIKLYKDIVFKPTAFCRNFDSFNINDSLTQYIEGEISYVRFMQKKLPEMIGEFNIINWNNRLAKKLNVSIIEEIRDSVSDIYVDLIEIFNMNYYDINNFDNVVYVNNVILSSNYRHRGVVDEFIEFIYRTYYNEKTLILFLLKPLQEISDDYKYIMGEKKVFVRTSVKVKTYTTIKASEYYGLNELSKYSDSEMNYLKLYSIGSRNGLIRIGDTNIFQMHETKAILNRIKSKISLVESNDSLNNPTQL